MKAYKGFNSDMTCRGFQYKEGKTEITVLGVPHILKAGQIIVMQKKCFTFAEGAYKIKN